MPSVDVEADIFSDREIIDEFAYRMKNESFRKKVAEKNWTAKPWHSAYDVDFHIPTLLSDTAHEIRKIGKLDMAFKLEMLR